ncbi:hypothetical protein CHARACLAT_026992 [Characodon lateralis]|uniref:Uncharacterized protein n=1 Tax=Characodon lateralis TaxID=208331 RepID=A0ABU7CUP3_9TELE|nr:hypothetical protein [Characodon lateralis]
MSLQVSLSFPTWALKSPSRMMESPRRGTMQHSQQGHQEDRVLRTTAHSIGQNDSQRPGPNPKAQGCDPLIHWGKPQHETAELGAKSKPTPTCCHSPWATPE